MIAGDVSFADMAKRVLGDPELRKLLPHRPALNAAYRVIEVASDQIVIAGGAEMRSIRGRHATMFRNLIKTLDGTEPLQEVMHRLSPERPDTALQAIAVLAYLGALEEGNQASAPEHAIDRQFCSRFISIARANASGAAALARLTRTTITLAGDAALLGDLSDAFAGSAITSRPWQPQIMPREQELVVLLEDVKSNHAGVALWADHAGVDVLHIGISRSHVHWGPLWRAGRAVDGYAAYHRHADVARVEGATILSEWWRAFCAHQIFLHVARLAECRYIDAFFAHDGASPWAPVRRHVIHPTAITERKDWRPSNGAAEVLRHHGTVRMPPAELISPSSHLHHYARQNIELATFAPLGDRAARIEGIALADDPAIAVEAAAAKYLSGDGLSLPVLSATLSLAYGYQATPDRRLRRIAPTGGALCSPSAFVAVRECEGVDRGIYRYCWDETPRLERWSDLNDHALAGALGVPELDAPAYVITAGRIGRVVQKYQEFAYNVVHYDTGVARAFLSRVLSTIGIAWRELPGIHGAACSVALDLPTAGEMMLVTGAVAIGDSRPTPIQGTYRDGALRALMRATSLIAPPSTTPAPVPDASARSLDELTRLLHARRSVRDYRTPPVLAAPLIHELLSTAHRANVRCRASGALPFDVPSYAILSGRTTEFPSGLYSFGGDQADVAHLIDLDADVVDASFVNQRALGAAPLKLVTAVDLPELLDRFGPAIYREALIRAGYIVGSVWIRALELGLAGVAAGGFLESACVEALSRADQPYSSTLLGFCCGHPAAGPVPEH